MIRSFKHKGLEEFFTTGSKAGINPQFASKLRIQLAQLTAASNPQQMDFPGYKLHELQHNEAGTWSIKVNGNWRLTFCFVGQDAEIVDLKDYH